MDFERLVTCLKIISSLRNQAYLEFLSQKFYLITAILFNVLSSCNDFFKSIRILSFLLRESSIAREPDSPFGLGYIAVWSSYVGFHNRLRKKKVVHWRSNSNSQLDIACPSITKFLASTSRFSSRFRPRPRATALLIKINVSSLPRNNNEY